MKALLLAGYHASSQNSHFSLKAANLSEDVSSNERPSEGNQTQLDYSIRVLQRLGFEVVVVLAGADADEVLRNSKLLPRVELVFDTHAETSLMTNLKAGLALTDNPCLFHPLEAKLPDSEKSMKLVNACYQVGLRTKFHGLTTAHLGALPSVDLFPGLITRSGNLFFKNSEDLLDLEDPRITWFSTQEGVENKDLNQVG